MSDRSDRSFTSFDGHRRLASGSLQENALATKRALQGGAVGPVLIFDDMTGRSIDVDTRGTEADVLARFSSIPAISNLPRSQADDLQPSAKGKEEGPRSRGRPRLGVVPREVTLLPRHWEWLARQPGGASVALRKLVEEARRISGDKDKARVAQERAYHFMTAMAGDMPGFEEATRALFANDRLKFNELIDSWPGDVRDHAARLAFDDGAPFASTTVEQTASSIGNKK